MAQITLNSSGVASSGALALQSNGTTTAVTINASQGVEFNAGAVGTPSITTTGDTNTGIFFPAADTIAFTEGGAEAMRIDSSGNVGIGTNSPNASYKMSITGNSASIYSGILFTDTNAGGGVFSIYGESAALKFRDSSAGATRMTIDSSGNLLVGTTSADGRITANASTSNASSLVLVGNTSAGNTLIRIRADGLYNLGLQTNSPYNFTSTGANAILFSDGTFGRATSSLKYKRNVETATHGLSDVLKLRSVTYKSKNERDGETIFGGLIAEEVHEIGLTEFVQYAEDGTPDSLYYANMVSLCIKAIQEQQALITTLTDRITALEAK
jgi:hypothetical protein